MDLLKDMAKKRNIACIVNLHQLDVALAYSTRIIGLSKGEVVFDGPPELLTDGIIERIYGTSKENLMIGGGNEKGISLIAHDQKRLYTGFWRRQSCSLYSQASIRNLIP